MAASGGFAGFLLALIAGSVFTGRGGYFHGSVALGVVGAGVGWLVGAAAGIVITKAPPPRTRAESWTLLGIAVVFLLAGFTFRWWVIEATPPSLHHLRFETLQQAVRLDAVLAAVTCATLAQRKFHRSALVLGAVVTVGITVTSAVLFATGPCSLIPSCPGPKL
jgi:hypothetical protein